MTTVWPNYGIANRIAEDLTLTQAMVLDFIVEFHDRDSRFPTVRDIRVKFGYRSVGAARYHVHELEKKGWLAGRPIRWTT
jgi:SOS-response transcriptional repressor LexA